MSAIGRFTRLLGTMSTYFRIGGTGGPQFKRNNAAMELRDTSDSGFANLRGAMPVGDSDFATKQYVDLANKPVTVAQQFDGNNALPANSGTEQLYVVTTTGAHATIGELLWDDGSGAGTVTVVPALDGRSIYTLADFIGGTVSLDADSYYVWSISLGTWQLESSPQIGGAIREIRFAIGTAASQHSAASVPANAQITDCQTEIVTPFSGGTTISVGRTGSAALLQATSDNLPTAAGTYGVEQDTAWGGASLPVLVTVAGGPVAGAGFVIVKFTQPQV